MSLQAAALSEREQQLVDAVGRLLVPLERRRVITESELRYILGDIRVVDGGEAG